MTGGLKYLKIVIYLVAGDLDLPTIDDLLHTTTIPESACEGIRGDARVDIMFLCFGYQIGNYV